MYQVMRKRITVSQTAIEVLKELVDELAIPHDDELELLFDAGNNEG